jgi:hypothetical protein
MIFPGFVHLFPWLYPGCHELDARLMEGAVTAEHTPPRHAHSAQQHAAYGKAPVAVQELLLQRLQAVQDWGTGSVRLKRCHGCCLKGCLREEHRKKPWKSMEHVFFFKVMFSNVFLSVDTVW